jgi:hypothetical protein
MTARFCTSKDKLVSPIIPAEHDARQFALIQKLYKVEDRIEALRLSMHRMAGDKESGHGRSRRWGMGFAEVSLRLTELAEAGDAPLRGYGKRPSEVLAQDAALLDEMRDLDAQAEAMEKTWRQHRWTRWYPCLNSDGHVHRTLNGCPTVNRGMSRTSMGWETSLSGKTVAEAIALLGPRLCSVCFPEAPVEHCQSLRDITRAQREAEAAARQEAKYVKGLRPAEQFRDHRGNRVETVHRCKEILRDEVELRDYFGRGAHSWHAASVAAAAQAARVLLAREEAAPGTGATQAEIDQVIDRAVKKNRKLGARI